MHLYIDEESKNVFKWHNRLPPMSCQWLYVCSSENKLHFEMLFKKLLANVFCIHIHLLHKLICDIIDQGGFSVVSFDLLRFLFSITHRISAFPSSLAFAFDLYFYIVVCYFLRFRWAIWIYAFSQFLVLLTVPHLNRCSKILCSAKIFGNAIYLFNFCYSFCSDFSNRLNYVFY